MMQVVNHCSCTTTCEPLHLHLNLTLHLLKTFKQLVIIFAPFRNLTMYNNCLYDTTYLEPKLSETHIEGSVYALFVHLTKAFNKRL